MPYSLSQRYSRGESRRRSQTPAQRYLHLLLRTVRSCLTTMIHQCASNGINQNDQVRNYHVHDSWVHKVPQTLPLLVGYYKMLPVVLWQAIASASEMSVNTQHRGVNNHFLTSDVAGHVAIHDRYRGVVAISLCKHSSAFSSCCPTCRITARYDQLRRGSSNTTRTAIHHFNLQASTPSSSCTMTKKHPCANKYRWRC